MSVHKVENVIPPGAGQLTGVFRSHPNFTEIIKTLETCIDDVNNWMIVNKLQLNSDQTECILFDARNELKDGEIENLHVGHDVVPFKSKAKNLGVFFDHHISMESHINHLCKLLYLELRRVGSMSKFLNEGSKIPYF